MSKPKTLKYRVTIDTDVKEFSRHRDMKKFVRTLNPITTAFKTEYWNHRTGVSGAYMPSWEWSTEGQLQYQANRAAHLARKAEHATTQLAEKEARKARKSEKISMNRVVRASRLANATPPMEGERVVSARPVHAQANKARKGYVPKVYRKKVA